MLAEICCDYFVTSLFDKADSHCNLQLFVTIGTIEKITHTKARTDRLVLSLQQGKVLKNSALQFLWQFKEFSRNCSNQENQELLKQVTLRL